MMRLLVFGGSGETRTRDQRIKRSRCFSFAYISIILAGGKNRCAIDCVIAFGYKVRICGSDFELLSVT